MWHAREPAVGGVEAPPATGDVGLVSLTSPRSPPTTTAIWMSPSGSAS